MIVLSVGAGRCCVAMAFNFISLLLSKSSRRRAVRICPTPAHEVAAQVGEIECRAAIASAEERADGGKKCGV